MANETEKNGASGSVVDENRGRDNARQHPKKRGTSKDIVASLDKRVAGVETSMAELKNQFEGLEGLGSDFDGMREDFRVALNNLSGDLKRKIHDLRDSFMGEITKIREEFGEEVSTLHQTIEDLQADLALCNRSLASGGGNANHGPKLDVPKSSPFVGKQEARAVDDFLWEMEQYLEGVNVRGTTTIDTWAGFVADFKKQFYPENAKNEVKSRLRKLKKSGTIPEYVKEFTTLRRVQDLATTIVHAEALIDFSMRRDSSKPKDQKVNHKKGRGDKNAQPKVNHARKPPSGKDKSMKMNYKSGRCFICDGPHRARDCPKKASLNGMSAHEDEDASNGGNTGSMRILNEIKVKMEVPKVIGKGLQYVEATINGVKVRALVDSGATHSFVAIDEAERLGINATKGSGTIKVVNSLAKPIHEVAKDARVKIGKWEGMIDLSVIPMDDFKVVLGLEFLDKVRAFPMPFANSLCILDGGKTCMVSTERDAKSRSKTLLAMQFKKGFNKSEPCYSAVTRLETDDGSSKVEVPKVIKRVLNEFKDMMPKELPKKLPPRREVDHTIELESGSKPPANAPYRMPPPELEEKKDESLWMCIDYWALNKVTIKNKYPIPLIADLFDQLGKARYFTKLDLRSGYYQVWIAEGDEAKMTYVTRFIMGYSTLASLLTDLLKKNQAWIWDKECQVAFESLKKAVMEEPVLRLPDTMQGIEMTAVIHCLRIWRHYLLGLRFVIKTDNIATSYYQTTSWQDFLADFDYQLEYKPRKANLVADTLSRKAEFAAITQAQFFLQDRIKEGLEHVPLAKKIVALAKDGKTRRFWLKGDMLLTKGDRLYIPKWGDLRRIILKECHDSKWAGHLGIKRTLALVEGTYYCPRMEDDVETFVRTCRIFQQDKIEQKKSGGLLEPLPTPKGPWKSVSMDFTHACRRVPHEIVSDRDPRFTGRFWMKLFKIMGTDLNFSMSFHSQTDGKTERVNALLELYLRHYVSANQHDWAKLLDVAQLSYNMQRSEATRKSPFELVMGGQPLIPNALAASYEGSSPTAYKTMKEWHDQADMAWASLEKATKRMKKWADERRRHVEFEVGDQVMVKLLSQQFKSLRKVHKGLIRRYKGPVLVIGRVGKVPYRVQLSPKLKIHPVFHVSFLKPYHGDEEDPERGVSKRAPTTVVTSYDRELGNGRLIVVVCGRDQEIPRGWNDEDVTSLGCRSSVRMTMHEVVHEMVVGECHEPNSEGLGSTWKEYVNARVAVYSYWSCWSTPTASLMEATSLSSPYFLLAFFFVAYHLPPGVRLSADRSIAFKPGFASTHLVECSMAMARNFKLLGAVGRRPRMLTP
uniref:Integrase catalytic domain-containing protein n=1 Tax=Tanacetum cinerariifolium TaxID=118510 RepID=A0A6L2L5F1_TANCI|nr:hypothetical protein [Tanacetum cinerariifolium]